VSSAAAGLGAVEIARDVRAQRRSAAETVREALDRIEADPELGAFLQTFPERALAAAGEVDARIARGEDPGPLAGVPVAVKDNICLDYGRTTAGSRILESYESPFSATAAERLAAAGAIVVGKTNLDEFGMGSSCEHSAFGPTRNPWDRARTPGGSSGGSAAAVAAGMVLLALGSDTGGSIRQPAAMCGVVGFKPTYGRVSRWGLVAYASSLDQIGPIGCSVADCAMCLEVIAGADPRDSTCAPEPAPRLLERLLEPVEKLRIAVARESSARPPREPVVQAMARAAEAFRVMGAEIVEVDLPPEDDAIAAYYLVAPAEASSNLARYDGVRYGRRAELRDGETLEDMYVRTRSEGFGPEVKRRIMLGTYALSAGYYDQYYLTALKTRRLIAQRYAAALVDCHALLAPVTPGPAFRLGERDADPMAMYLEDVYTVGVSLAGLPSIALPAGFAEVDGSRLPVGVQLVGRAFDEATLVRVGQSLEGALNLRAQLASLIPRDRRPDASPFSAL
jgi:aspartyl-tRNA(Asn)/glutamyl-tRNA(Gln) amidotransferase subunit A